MFWKARPLTEEPSGLDKNFSQLPRGQETPRPAENISPELYALPVILFLITGLFCGAFTVALLFRRIAIALAVTGPLLFSAIWILWDWKKFHYKRYSLGAFAAGFTLTFLALDREP